jgi:hypothetical protein
MLAGLTNDKQENEDSSLMKYWASQWNLTSYFNFENRQVPVTLYYTASLGLQFPTVVPLGTVTSNDTVLT